MLELVGHMMLISIHFRFRKYFVRFLLFLPRLFFGKDCFREADRSPGNHSLPPSNRNSLRRSSMRRRDSSRTTLSKRVSISILRSFFFGDFFTSFLKNSQILPYGHKGSTGILRLLIGALIGLIKRYWSVCTNQTHCANRSKRTTDYAIFQISDLFFFIWKTYNIYWENVIYEILIFSVNYWECRLQTRYYQRKIPYRVV